MEKRSLTGVVSFDLRRAFNTVDLAYYLNLNVMELKARKRPGLKVMSSSESCSSHLMLSNLKLNINLLVPSWINP